LHVNRERGQSEFHAIFPEVLQQEITHFACCGKTVGKKKWLGKRLNSIRPEIGKN